jgi:hypothetical protein
MVTGRVGQVCAATTDGSAAINPVVIASASAAVLMIRIVSSPRLLI